MTAGVIGLGQIGGGVAMCLARAGMLTAVFDVRSNAADGLAGVPALAGSPAEVARLSDVVIIAVISAAQTVAALSGLDGVLAAARPELSVVLLATVSLEDLDRIRALTDAAGVVLIDCGVAGGPKAAENGIVCLVGAEAAALARVRPVLDGFARSVMHMGGPGAGMAAKIVRNVIAVGCLRAGYEGAALAKAVGVDLRQLIKVIDDTADSGIGPLMILGRPADPLVDGQEAATRENLRGIMVKDSMAALQLGHTVGVALPLVELTRDTSYDVMGARRDA